MMRQPLEDRVISISRARYATEYPASFMLVASMNPCPCGYYGHPKKPCVCTDYQRINYMSKISGPLLDRIDLQIEVQPVEFEQISSKQAGESSAAIRARVIAARDIQAQRFQGEKGIYCNAQMTPKLLHKYAEPDAAGLEQLRDAMDRMNMSARAYDRILKVARTIADLKAAPTVQHRHTPHRVSSNQAGNRRTKDSILPSAYVSDSSSAEQSATTILRGRRSYSKTCLTFP